MSTLVAALIVVLSIALVLFLLLFQHDRQRKKRTKEMLHRFSKLGSEYNLSFTAQEVLGNCIIGVDGIKRKLLFLEHNKAGGDWSLVDLARVKGCRVQKLYGSIEPGNAAAKNVETYLRAIILEFDFEDSSHTVALPFYNIESNSMQEVPELEAKAKYWQAVLVKMITKERKQAQAAGGTPDVA